MIDIFIKSFNRPFYLDRSIASIYKFVKGDFTIKVLDDGTPKKYLEKIQEKYPDVQILFSENYHSKCAIIIENLKSEKKINGFQIPTNLWIDAVKKATDYFIITEDDCWFTKPVQISQLRETCYENNIYLLKIGWLGCFSDDRFQKIESINSELNRCIPEKLILKGEFFMKMFFYNRFKLFTILYKFGIVNNETRQRYWVLNSILMGFYKKEYWLEIWKGMDGKVDEKRQLINASVFYKKHQNNPNFIARLKNEAMKTTFQSSATNSYHEYGYNFDVNIFNHLINETWSNGDFDVFQNFPNDFSLDYFEQFVKEKIDVKEFRKWVSHFKNQYKNLGANVE
ncbi:glycosyltransferase family 2 protein [Halpernia sp.]|uniref:glycosyltransferase family 2 protein n=1 Tax=Halpernia sp. TaxID=2782209 RepID=UPI003A927AB2